MCNIKLDFKSPGLIVNIGSDLLVFQEGRYECNRAE